MANARGQYDSAARAFRRALKASEPAGGPGDGGLVACRDRADRGRLAEARRLDRLAAQLEGTGRAALRPVLNDVWTVSTWASGGSAPFSDSTA